MLASCEEQAFISVSSIKNVCQPSCFALALFTSYLGNLSYITKNRQGKYFFIAFSLKYVGMTKCIPTTIEFFYGFKMKT